MARAVVATAPERVMAAARATRVSFEAREVMAVLREGVRTDGPRGLPPCRSGGLARLTYRQRRFVPYRSGASC
ncbi:hypothetical protein GCM10020229_23730 [Kitasatospora albolonga]